jgi:hypothetical protein
VGRPPHFDDVTQCLLLFDDVSRAISKRARISKVFSHTLLKQTLGSLNPPARQQESVDVRSPCIYKYPDYPATYLPFSYKQTLKRDGFQESVLRL